MRAVRRLRRPGVERAASACSSRRRERREITASARAGPSAGAEEALAWAGAGPSTGAEEALAGAGAGAGPAAGAEEALAPEGEAGAVGVRARRWDSRSSSSRWARRERGWEGASVDRMRGRRRGSSRVGSVGLKRRISRGKRMITPWDSGLTAR
ncbi:hypothetical protein DVJ78_06415 [Humibacter sp. BT305]|nr:hypothetical protein DVJ78_06415 [Humibacter sp. BT305]